MEVWDERDSQTASKAELSNLAATATTEPNLGPISAAVTAYRSGDDEACIANADAVASRSANYTGAMILKALAHERRSENLRASETFVMALEALVGASPLPSRTTTVAIPKIIGGLKTTSPDRLAGANAQAIANGFHRLGIWTTLERESAAALASLPANLVSRRDFSHELYMATLRLLDFPSARSQSWQDLVFRTVVVPMFRAFLGAGQFNYALTIEVQLYDSYVKVRENSEHFRTVYAQLAPLFATAGRALGKRAPALAPIVRKSRYRVAFVTLNLLNLAHVSTTIDIIECIQKLPDRRIECALMGFLGPDPAVEEKCRRLGIPVHTSAGTHGNSGDATKAIMDLRLYLATHGYDAVVWVTVAPMCAFSMAMRLAPVQIFFAMKYHSFSIPEIDEYLSGGPSGQTSKVIEGRTWRIAQSRYADLFDPSASDRAKEMRSSVGAHAVVLGCIGRSEKINSPQFLDAVSEILSRHRHAVFVWTGKDKLESIQKHFENAGVVGQTVFAGWVDTRLYAQVIDIFLDSFPFPCGVTALQSMAAGKAAVFYDSPEARETGVPLFVSPLLSGEAGTDQAKRRVRDIFSIDTGEPTYLLATDRDHYVSLADRVVADADYRAKVGAALRTFADEFVVDMESCGRTYEQHIFEAIEMRARSA